MSTVSRIYCVVIAAILIHINCSALPNILFLLIDDLGFNDLSMHNGSDYLTPNIDKLAANGLELNNYYIQHICTPTRSSLMAGRYPIHTGLQHGVILADQPYGLPLDLTIIPQDLKRVGYKTHIIGKWHLGFFAPEYTPLYRGFDTHFGYYEGMEDYYFHNNSHDNLSGYDLRNQTKPIMLNGKYSTYLYGNETIRILKQYHQNSNNNSFFLYLPFQSVHGPLEAPQYIIDSFAKTIPDIQRRTLAAMTTVLDDVIGQIVDFLQNNGLWDDLILIFSTDNGGPVQESNSNFPLRGSKASLWEGGVKGDGFITGGWLNDDRRGQQMNALMHITDFYPTLMEIVGITATNTSILDGYSQLNNIQKGETDIYSPRQEILHNIDPDACKIEICGAIRMKQYKLVVGNEVTSSADNYCRSGWCPLEDVNQNYTTIQCTANGGNYNYPLINQNYTTHNCPYNNKACLYDIVLDPCEYYDISEQEVSIYQQAYNRLLYYNSSMVTPLTNLNPANATAANPDNFGGFWSPWVNHTNFTNKFEL